MPVFEFAAPDGKTYEVTAPEGATQQQAFEMLQGQLGAAPAPAPAPAAPTPREPSGTFSTGRVLNDIGRQLGLTARYALTGPAEAAQIFTEPARRLVTDPLARLITGGPTNSRPLGEAADEFADAIGLPRPQNQLERVVGEGTKLGFGALAGARGFKGVADNYVPPGGGPGGPNWTPGMRRQITDAAPSLLTPAEKTLQGLVSAPGAQVSSAAGAGLAGQTSKEAGGTPSGQFLASVAGGMGGYGAARLADNVSGALGTGARAVRNLLTPSVTTQDVDIQLTRALGQAGTDYAALPAAAKLQLREDARRALSAGQTLDPARLARLADFRAEGVPSFRGAISRDPVDFTQDMNLGKVGANTNDSSLQTMARRLQEADRVMIGRLDDLANGARTEPGAAGQRTVSAITSRDAANEARQRQLWQRAEELPGMDRQINAGVLSDVNAALERRALTMHLPPEISRYMQAFQEGRPFTPRDYANLRSLLSSAQSAGGNTARAASEAVRVLDAARLRPVQAGGHIDFGSAPVPGNVAQAMRASDAQAGEAIDAINQARRATRDMYSYRDSSPLVRQVLGEGRSADPEKIASSYVLRGTAEDARRVLREIGPEGTQVVRDSLATYIRNRALNNAGATNEAGAEVGKISQKGLNDALRNIGDEKLRLFFTPEEIESYRRLGRVASYLQVQPTGSAVNNSNTSGALMGRGLDILDALARKLPGGKMAVGDMVQDWRVTLGQRTARQVPISAPPMPAAAQPLPPFLLPGAALGGGLLSAPGQ